MEASARGHGRNGDCSSLPVQIRAGGFPAPGSCLRSHVIGLRGMGYPCSSDPWARCFGDMPYLALCPGHASQLALPSTGRLPSTISAGDVARHCSRLPRYYAAVRLPLASAAAIGRTPPRNQPSTPLAAPVRPLSGLYVFHGWPGASCRPRGCKAAQEALSQATVDGIVGGEPSAWLLSQTASSRSSARWCAAWPTGRPRGRALRAKVECKFQ